MRYEYTAIPAPTRGEKSAETKTPTDRYALTLGAELNRMAAAGWEYVRADVLPSEERSGLTGRTTVYHNLLIFRRTLAAGAAQDAGAASPATPQPEYPVAASPAQAPVPVPDLPQAAAPQQSDYATGNDLASNSDDPHAPVPPAPREGPANP